MPVLILIIALFFPRLGALLLWLFTGFFNTIDLLWVILGIIFAPMTLLWVAAVMNWFGGVWGVPQIIILVLALLYDFGWHGYGWHYWYPGEVEQHIEPEHHI